MSGGMPDTAIPFPLQPPAKFTCGKLVELFQHLRADIMKKNERTQTAIENQDTRILNSYAWFPSPRQEKTKKLSGRKKDLRRIRHGSVRAIEDLRGLRLSLVSGQASRDGLLQGM